MVTFHLYYKDDGFLWGEAAVFTCSGRFRVTDNIYNQMKADFTVHG